MPAKNIRHPMANFFVKRSIQVRIIFQVVIAVVITATLTTGSLAWFYGVRSRQGNFYYMSKDVRQDIELKSLLGLVLPSVVGVQTLGIIIGLAIGMYSSRKVAVPIYKFEKWVRQIRAGKLTAHLAFRESDQMKDLAIECNEMAHTMRETLRQISEAVDATPETASTAGSSAKIKALLSRFEY